MSQHVVIAGGGVGALEGLLALQHLAGDRLRITVIAPSRHLVYRALSVAEPFGGEPAPRYEWAAIARDRGVEWLSDSVDAIRPDAREVVTHDGPPVHYDGLLLSLGARPEPAVADAVTFAGPRDVLEIREAIAALAPGQRHAIAFVAPAGVGWTLPLYELALMTAAYGRARGLDLQLELITQEHAPLEAFGAAASRGVEEQLTAAGIAVRGEAAGDAELVIALPRLHGPGLAGVPADAGGFVPVDPYGRVRGVEHVWAVGDMTARPLKQGGLAAQQADVAAADIAARVAGVDVPVRPYRPRLRGKLLTGGDPLFVERRPGAPSRSQASPDFLWWPDSKIAGRHVGAYLASGAAAPSSADRATRDRDRPRRHGATGRTDTAPPGHAPR